MKRFAQLFTELDRRQAQREGGAMVDTSDADRLTRRGRSSER